MSLTTHERHSVYPAIFDALTVNHIRSVMPSPGLQQMLIIPGGAVDVAIAQEAFRDPTVRITSGDLGTILGSVSPTAGLAISSSGEIQYQHRADGGTFQGAGAHVTLNSTKGFLIVERISAVQDAREGAELALLYYALRSGSNAPFIFNTGQSLAGSPAANALYKLGPVVFEGSKIGGIQRTNVATGITYQTKRESGATSADVGSIVGRGPTFEVEGTNLTLAAQISFGRGAMTLGITIYFQKVGASPSDPVHISFTLASGDYVLQDLSGDGQGDVTERLVATGAGSGAQLSYSTTAVIP